MKKDQLFYWEIKNESGEYEPLGVMTHSEATAYAWERDHATIQGTPVKNLSPMEAV